MILGPSNHPANRLGRRLRKLRTDRNWTLAYVSENHGIDKAVLSRVERGDSTPSLATLYRLRDAYVVDDETFLTWLDMVREREHNGDAA